MTDLPTAGAAIRGSLHAVDGAGVVRLEGAFDAAAEQVWAALTEPGRLGQWLGDVEGELRPGGEFSARFFATGWEGTCRVDACEPSQRLRIVTRSEGEPDCVIEVTLRRADGQTLLVIEDRGLPLDQLAAYGAGDQVLAEDLAAHLSDQGRCDAKARWQALQPAYQHQAAALAADSTAP